MTDSRRLPDPAAAIASLPPGSAVIVRNYDDARRAALARRLVRLCRPRGIRLLVAGDARLAAAVGAGGLHLPEAMARGGARRWALWRRPDWMVTAAAHGPAALRAAWRAGADAALLAPLYPTASHPGRAPIGALRFALLCRQSPLPVYALGGVSARNVRRLKGSGAAGVAAIAALAAGPRDREEGEPPLAAQKKGSGRSRSPIA